MGDGIGYWFGILYCIMCFVYRNMCINKHYKCNKLMHLIYTVYTYTVVYSNINIYIFKSHMY